MPAAKKHPSVRRRTNTASSAAVLEHQDDEIEVPDLPERDWCQETLAWWADVWTSPMANEYLDADLHGLIRLAALVDNYWRNPCAKTHAEVRLAQKDYGLTPYDRRRLEWTIEGTEDAKAKGRRRRAAEQQQAPQPVQGLDPRLKLVT